MPFLHQAEGLVVIYAVDDRKSFDHVKKIKRFVDQQKKALNLPMIIVGSKCDLENRAISHEEGEALAESLGIPFLEASALTGMNCEEIFKQIVRQIKMEKSNPSLKEGKSDSCKCNIF